MMKGMRQNQHFLDYHDSDATIEIHHFSFEWFSSKEVLFERLMKDFKLVVLAKSEFENHI